MDFIGAIIIHVVLPPLLLAPFLRARPNDRHEQGDHGTDDKDGSQGSVKDEEVEELVIVVANTTINPWAVVVHPKHALVALGAMMAPVGFDNLTNVAPPRSSVSLADTQSSDRSRVITVIVGIVRAISWKCDMGR